MRRKKQPQVWNPTILWSGAIGTITGWLLILLGSMGLGIQIPGFEQMSKVVVIPAGFLTELALRLICARTRDMGCGSFYGFFIFLFTWLALFILMWALIGVAVGLMLVMLRRIPRFCKSRRSS